jgi:hypothetical protein
MTFHTVEYNSKNVHLHAYLITLSIALKDLKP